MLFANRMLPLYLFGRLNDIPPVLLMRQSLTAFLWHFTVKLEYFQKDASDFINIEVWVGQQLAISPLCKISVIGKLMTSGYLRGSVDTRIPTREQFY